MLFNLYTKRVLEKSVLDSVIQPGSIELTTGIQKY